MPAAALDAVVRGRRARKSKRRWMMVLLALGVVSFLLGLQLSLHKEQHAQLQPGTRLLRRAVSANGLAAAAATATAMAAASPSARSRWALRWTP